MCVADELLPGLLEVDLSTLDRHPGRLDFQSHPGRVLPAVLAQRAVREAKNVGRVTTVRLEPTR